MTKHSRKRIEVNLDRVKSLLDAACSPQMIGNALGVSRDVIVRVLREQGWTNNTSHPLLEAVRTLAAEGLTRKEIADRLSTSYFVVDHISRTYKVKVNRKYGSIDHAEIARLHGLGLTNSQIREVLGCDRDQVCDSLRQQGRKSHVPPPKIPESARDLINRLVSDYRWHEEEVATLFGCRQECVSRYLIAHGIKANCGRGRRRKRDHGPSNL